MDILEIRVMWIMCIVFFGIILPLASFMFYAAHRQHINKPVHKNYFIAIFVYVVSMFAFGRDLIPEKYDVEYKKVYECGYVEKLFPKYPDGVPEK